MYCLDCGCYMCELYIDTKETKLDVVFFTRCTVENECNVYTKYRVIKYICPICGVIKGDVTVAEAE